MKTLLTRSNLQFLLLIITICLLFGGLMAIACNNKVFGLELLAFGFLLGLAFTASLEL